jgi:hypothetical protein
LAFTMRAHSSYQAQPYTRHTVAWQPGRMSNSSRQTYA